MDTLVVDGDYFGVDGSSPKAAMQERASMPRASSDGFDEVSDSPSDASWAPASPDAGAAAGARRETPQSAGSDTKRPSTPASPNFDDDGGDPPAPGRYDDDEGADDEPAEKLRTVVFQSGPLGLTMKRTAGGAVVVHTVSDKSQADGQLAVGERIVTVGEIDVRKLDREGWKRAIDYIKAAPRPIEFAVSDLPFDSDDDGTEDPRREDALASAPRKEDAAAAAPPPPPPDDAAAPPDDAGAAAARADETEDARRRDPLLRAVHRAEVRAADLAQRLMWPDDIPASARALATGALVLSGRVAVWRPANRLWRSLGGGGWQDRVALLFSSGALVVAAPAAGSPGPKRGRAAAPERLDVERCCVVAVCTLRRRCADVDALKGVTDTESSFDVVAPDGSVAFKCDAKAAVVWRCALAAAALGGRQGGGAWRHAVLGGTALSLAACCDAQRPAPADAGGDAEVAMQVALAADLQRLDAEGAACDARDASGRTALHVAASRGAVRAISALVDAGCSTAALDEHGRTAVHVAALGWHDGAVSVLLAADADARDICDAQDVFRQTPAHCAVSSALDDDPALRRRPPNTSGDGAGVRGLERLSRTLLALSSWGASLEARDGAGWTVVHRLAAARLPSEIDVALRCGGDAGAALLAAPRDGPVARGATALHLAFAAEARHGSAGGGDAASRLALTCDALLRHGCDATAADARGERAPVLGVKLARNCTPALAAAVVQVCAATLAAARAPAAATKDEAAKDDGAARAAAAEALRVESREASLQQGKAAQRDAEAGWAGLADSLDRLAQASPAGPAPAGAAGVTGWFNALRHPKAKAAAEESRRADLFGGARPASPAAATATQKTLQKGEGATADFGEIRNAVSQRGEKLSKLSEKSDELANASEEFEKMCSQLNKHQKSNNRWFG
ncbi:hypothetical protein M885DRAFT_476633 [Pelagophyceae sp. CCMP2097]|nr:hypothetical protein M885DRAFT_476633 [Pelagophyceae sp. CCMP2097]